MSKKVKDERHILTARLGDGDFKTLISVLNAYRDLPEEQRVRDGDVGAELADICRRWMETVKRESR